jgi:hypothetical protein
MGAIMRQGPHHGLRVCKKERKRVWGGEGGRERGARRLFFPALFAAQNTDNSLRSDPRLEQQQQQKATHAQKSTSTGTSDLSTRSSNVVSLTGPATPSVALVYFSVRRFLRLAGFLVFGKRGM